jgi:hypothetical protein
MSGRGFLALHHYKKREGVHWNERGHRRVAEELKRFCASLREEKGASDARVDEVRSGVGSVASIG